MLGDESLLEALGDSSQLPLTAKRTLAMTTREMQRVIGRHLENNDLWVYKSDRTVSNARWLAKRADANPNLRIHVYDGLGALEKSEPQKPIGHLGKMCAIGKQEMPMDTTSRGFAATAQAQELEELQEAAENDAAVLNGTVAYFLGHLLVGLPRDDVGIRATNGREYNLSAVAKAVHMHRVLGPGVFRELTRTDWMFLAGALFQNALHVTERVTEVYAAPLGMGMRKSRMRPILRYRKLFLTDDAMTHVGAKVRADAADHVRAMYFANNRFGGPGTAALFSTQPLMQSLRVPAVVYPQLEVLSFDDTPIGVEGLPYITNAMVTGCLPVLSTLRLVNVRMDNASAHALFGAIGTKGASQLRNLSVSHNPFDGFALQPLKTASWRSDSLFSIRAHGLTAFCPKDYAILARAILDGKMPSLKSCSNHPARGQCVQAAMAAHLAAQHAKAALQAAECPPPKPMRKMSRILPPPPSAYTNQASLAPSDTPSEEEESESESESEGPEEEHATSSEDEEPDNDNNNDDPPDDDSDEPQAVEYAIEDPMEDDH